MISVKCYRCDCELCAPGALLFSPPDDDGVCEKFHLCRACYVNLMERFL